jgi:hypothetical protein
MRVRSPESISITTTTTSVVTRSICTWAPPREPARGLETPEGHTVEYDEGGATIGLELLNVRTTLEREGAIAVAWPQVELSAQQLDPVLVSA